MAAPAEAETPEVNSVLLSLVLIFIPGILCYGIIAALAEKKDRDNVTMFLQIFMYGVCSYLLLAGAHWLRPNWFPDISTLAILNPVEIEKSRIDPFVIAEASGFGIVQGLIITLNLNRQLVLKLLRKIKLTGRFGDEDVWTLLLNSTATDNYVTIRHRDNGLIYQGYVSGFSSGGERRELLVINVRVFNAEAIDEEGTVTEVGEIPFLYLAFKEDEITLELGRPPGKSQISYEIHTMPHDDKPVTFTEGTLKKGGQNPPPTNYRPPPPQSFTRPTTTSTAPPPSPNPPSTR